MMMSLADFPGPNVPERGLRRRSTMLSLPSLCSDAVGEIERSRKALFVSITSCCSSLDLLMFSRRDFSASSWTHFSVDSFWDLDIEQSAIGACV